MIARRRLSPLCALTAIVLAATAAAGLLGCGYTTRAAFPADVRTVAVPIFENRTYTRGIEFDLTEALVKQIELSTPYKVSRSAAAADTLLKGTVVAVDRQVLSYRAEGGLPQELEVRITVDFSWQNLRTGQMLRQRQGFTAVGRYVPARPVGEHWELGRHEAVQRLASDIVSVMRSDWGPTTSPAEPGRETADSR